MSKPLTGYEKEIAILHDEARLDYELIEEFKGKAYEYKQAIQRVRELATNAITEQEQNGGQVTLFPSAILKALDGEQ